MNQIYIYEGFKILKNDGNSFYTDDTIKREITIFLYDLNIAFDDDDME